jgi:hypothetical protein
VGVVVGKEVLQRGDRGVEEGGRKREGWVARSLSKATSPRAPPVDTK